MIDFYDAVCYISRNEMMLQKRENMLSRISTLDAVFIALMAACGLALKPIVGPLFKLVSSALLIPSGSMAGVIYMIWPMLAVWVVRRFGTAFIVGLIQGIIILVTGIYGSHGILTLITYTLPGFVIDATFALASPLPHRFRIPLPAAMGNLSGTLLISIVIMHLPKIPLLIGLIPSFIFGGIGGYLSWIIYLWLIKTFPIFNKANAK